MARFRNLFTAAIALKQRKIYPPDLVGNALDGPFLASLPAVSPAADLVRAQWATAIGNQSAPALDPLTMVPERGYYEELPWDE